MSDATTTKGAVLVLGGKSDIGRAIARAFAGAGHAVMLAGRGTAAMEADRADIELRHRVPVSVHEFDVLETAGHAAFADALPALPEIVVSVVGYMGDQAESEADPEAAAQVMRTNYEGPAAILALFANRFEARGSGVIIGISSVAGDRGRATNYVYGSAKAGFTAFLSGLRNRLARTGVQVITVLPGFVATAMTEGMDLPGKLTAEPEEVAQAVLRAVRKGRDVIYVKPVWWLVMAVIRNIPEGIFKGLKI